MQGGIGQGAVFDSVTMDQDSEQPGPLMLSSVLSDLITRAVSLTPSVLRHLQHSGFDLLHGPVAQWQKNPPAVQAPQETGLISGLKDLLGGVKGNSLQCFASESCGQRTLVATRGSQGLDTTEATWVTRALSEYAAHTFRHIFASLRPKHEGEGKATGTPTRSAPPPFPLQSH